MAKAKKIAVLDYSNGRTIIKDKAAGDTLDRFLSMMDDPDDWRTVPNEETNELTKLTVEELDIIKRIQNSEYADAGYDPYEPYVDFFTGQVMEVPLNSAPEPKRRFIPSRWEALRVRKIVKAIRRGYIKLEDETEVTKPRDATYDIWEGETDASILARQARHIEAPKITPPGHRESYNPPPEYLLSAEEKAKWEAMDSGDRPFGYLPEQYSAFRLVPGYARAVQERFGRCLDLLLCPRAIKQKISMNPDDLLPVLPDPRELRPFPTSRSIDFVGHLDAITSISVDPTCQWLLSSSKDKTVKLWDSQTGHCRYTWSFADDNDDDHDRIPQCVAWNPNRKYFLFAVALGKLTILIIPPATALTEMTHEAVAELDLQSDSASIKSSLLWKPSKHDDGRIYSIEHPSDVSKIQWHRHGDYFSTLSPTASSGSQILFIHQLSRKCSQSPFAKMPGLARAIAFHPTRPQVVLATSKGVRIYDLVKHELIKKLIPGADSISDVAIHPTGDHIVASCHDSKLLWFDLDYSIRPYRTLNNHRGAIRSVAIHPSFPLLASGGDDGVVQVIHATVYSDLTSNPLIVPVKTLRDFGSNTSPITQVIFHPTQPWLFAATSIGTISLFV